MHKFEFSQDIIDRVTKRRGVLHPFADFNLAKTALVVVDMQNSFVDPEYATSVPEARSVVLNINTIAASLRQAGGLVVWLQNTAGAEDQSTWSNWFEHFVSDEMRPAYIDNNRKGAHGLELWHELQIDDQDEVVVKNRFSAFIQGSSSLTSVLQERGIDTLLVTGTVTNVCCESTARDAAMLNFKVIMVTDGNAARSDAEHSASLNSLFNVFADVLTTEQVLTRINSA